jgi:3-hydroxyisobutyrate dehydrogenase
MNVGWIGLGAMGAPMARRLLGAGHRVVGYDVVPAARERFAADGGVAAASAAEAATGADVLVLMVATPGQGEEVLFAHGVADALAPGSRLVVAATVGPEAVADWEQRLTSRGVRLVDAPVSGGVGRAESGDLLVMPAGSRDDLDAVRPLLEALASASDAVGSRVGDGQRMKLVNQLLCGVHIAAAAEALALAAGLGLEPERVWETLRHGAAASFMLDDRGARMLQAEPPVRSAVDIFVKDMGLVVGAAETAGMEPTLASAARTRFVQAQEAGLGRADDSRIVDTYGLPVHPPSNGAGRQGTNRSGR